MAGTVDRRDFLKGSFAVGALVAGGGCACSCAAHAAEGGLGLDATSKGATAHTAAANEEVYALLDFSDETEREFATRGLIAAPEQLEIADDEGRVIWSQKAYGFLDMPDGTPAEAPETCNPSLWRHTQLNHLYGLFEVCEGIYQVRGYDMTNITFVQGDTGWIVFDPLMSVECSRAALALVNEHLGGRPVTGIVMSHPHVDHYGGIKGVVTPEEVAERAIPLIVPEGFEKHAVAENVYAGAAMARRAGYQYGVCLDPGEQGALAIGIGMGQSKGTVSYIPPNDVITQTGERRLVDGVEMEFHMTPGTEAPAEMNTWFPQKKALWLAENCTGTLHNLYTLRGAEVRDGNAWANYIMEARQRYGAEVEVCFQSHNWPHFGNEIISEYLLNTAAVYKFIATQSLMYLNQGYTSTEIAHMIELPDDLARVWYTRQYYGTLAHNSRAVYQKYMGYYDGNPVNLNRLPPQDEARRMASYLGDPAAVLARARQDFEAGEYQWVAQIANLLVFADPQNIDARLLCADALEQLGYQAESGPWRNVYLSGALELRHGVDRERLSMKRSNELASQMPLEMMLDNLAILVDANAASGLNMVVNLNDVTGEPYTLTVKSGVVLHQKGQSPQADATVTFERRNFSALFLKTPEALSLFQIEGDQDVLAKLSEHVVQFDRMFNLVEP